MYANSQFCVCISFVFTESFNVRVGVRQGYPLDPNLFRIFINDLPSYLESTADLVHLNNIDLHCLMYAGDLVILLESAIGLQESLSVVIHTFKLEYLLSQLTNLDQILCVALLG